MSNSAGDRESTCAVAAESSEDGRGEENSEDGRGEENSEDGRGEENSEDGSEEESSSGHPSCRSGAASQIRTAARCSAGSMIRITIGSMLASMRA